MLISGMSVPGPAGRKQAGGEVLMEGSIHTTVAGTDVHVTHRSLLLLMKAADS